MYSFVTYYAKVLLTAAVLFVAMNGVLSLQKQNYRYPIYNRFNEIVLERFANTADKWDIVVAGSSAATNIPPYDYWPENSYTISQQGGTALTGLEAIIRSGAHPKKVFLEGNFFDRDHKYDPYFYNQSILDMTFNNLNIHRIFPVLKQENNIFNAVNMLFTKYDTLPEQMHPDYDGSFAEKKNIITERAKAYTDHSEITDTQKTLLRNNLALAKQYAEILSHNGTKVYFYSLPMHPDVIRNRDIARYSLEEAEKTLSSYPWIHLNYEEYMTTDGIHPTVHSGYKIFEKFNSMP